MVVVCDGAWCVVVSGHNLNLKIKPLTNSSVQQSSQNLLLFVLLQFTPFFRGPTGPGRKLHQKCQTVDGERVNIHLSLRGKQQGVLVAGWLARWTVH